MIMPYIQVCIFTILIGIIANFVRFKGSNLFNKVTLVTASLVLVGVHELYLNNNQSIWILLVFVVISSICFSYFGAVLSACIAWVLLVIVSNVSDLKLMISYLLFAVCVSFISTYIVSLKKESGNRLTKLISNSKQLNVFREVSSSMQQTLHLQKLLQTILTSVTAGYGLGFNRAMILLIDENGTKLNGIMGTGPMSAEEGFATWERLAKNKYKLIELIEIKESEDSSDQLLNEKVKKLEITLDEPNFLYKTLESGFPLHISEIDNSDQTLFEFVSEFKMEELAIIPLINQGIKVGVLIIDNPVNKKPITSDDIDSVIPLANQAAIAIQHAHLYTKIEDMALKDGLTGLFNLRAFQTSIEVHTAKSNQSQFSLIIIDIDFFKHYNDTNGHMLGNQVLIQLAEVIQDSIKKDHIPFRFGGEEFIILLPDTSLDLAVSVAESIRENVVKTPFPCGEKQPLGRLTISIGVASTEGLQESNSRKIVDAADKALYKAKETGKNKVVSFEGVITS